jgi:hypothetical protein
VGDDDGDSECNDGRKNVGNDVWNNKSDDVGNDVSNDVQGFRRSF